MQTCVACVHVRLRVTVAWARCINAVFFYCASQTRTELHVAAAAATVTGADLCPEANSVSVQNVSLPGLFLHDVILLC